MEIRTQSKSCPPVHSMADRTSAPNWRAMRWTAFSSSIGPWRRSSSRVRSIEESSAVKRPTWLCSAGVALLRMPKNEGGP